MRLVGILLIGALLLISGCQGARETDEVSYILAIGIDSGSQEGNLRVSYQLAVPAGEAQGDQTPKTGGKGNVTEIITIEAANLGEARNLLKSAIARTPNFNHTKAFIIGEGLARKGLEDIISPLLRFREYRGTMFVFVAYGTTAQDFMMQNKPRFELLPSKYFETAMFTFVESGYYLRTSLHEFYDRLKGNAGAPLAVLYAINPETCQRENDEPKTAPGKTQPVIPGQMKREGGNPAEAIGLAVFKQAKMIGILNSEETRMLTILRGDFKGGFVVVEDPIIKGKAVNCFMRLARAPKIKVSVKQGKFSIEVKVLLEGTITSTPSGINYETEPYRGILENQVSEFVRKDMEKMISNCKAMGADAPGFGYYARGAFSNFQESMGVNWSEMFQQADVKIEVDSRLRRSDLVWRTSPIK